MTDERQNRPILSADFLRKLKPRSTAEFIASKIGDKFLSILSFVYHRLNTHKLEFELNLQVATYLVTRLIERII